LLEHGTPGAHEIEEALFVDVSLEKLTTGRIGVDVELGGVDVMLFQKTSGVAAGRSGRFPVKSDARHENHCTPAVGRIEPRRVHRRSRDQEQRYFLLIF
jgi:hypothetical protein